MPLRNQVELTSEPLYLIDGSTFLYRAFYAYPDLKRGDGFPTNAIFIVLRLLFKIFREEKPSHMAFFLDGKKPTFRKDIFEEYKAQRPKMPEPLSKQIPPLLEVVEYLGVTSYVTEGYEADDCIAGLAKRFKKEHSVVIVGSDKDLYQCLDHRVHVWDPGQKKEKIVTLDQFREQNGLTPSQWPDYQALIGDQSDNIPGVPGIGPKTALRLLSRFPSLEKLRENFDRLTAKEQEKLKPHLEDIFTYRELTTLRTDLCQDISLQNLQVSKWNKKGLSHFFQEYEFKSFAQELDLEENNTAPRQSPSPSFSRPENLPDPDIIGEEQIGIVMENSSLHLGVKGKEYLYKENPASLIPHLRRATLVAPSMKTFLSRDESWSDIPVGQWFDVGLAAYLLNPEERDYSWQAVKERLAGLDIGELPPDVYPGLLALRLGRELKKQLVDADLLDLMYSLELPLIPVLVDMEKQGIRVDLQAFDLFLKEVQNKLNELSLQIFEMAGGEFNIRSSQQLAEVLFNTLGLESKKKTPGGAPSTSSPVLEVMVNQHPVIGLILEYRILEKLRSTYLKPLPKLVDNEGRIHTTFNNLATATGRLSSSKPNLQNIPIRGKFGPRMRSCFVSGPGHSLVAADYSQIELRVLAHMSREPFLIHSFESDEDIHAMTASVLFSKEVFEVTLDERRKAKTINFGLIYGMGPQKLARELGITMNEAKSFIETYFSRFEKIGQFYEEVEQRAKEKGYVKTIFGRRRLLPDINSRNQNLAQQARRMAINTVIQGSAADIIKMAMLNVHDDAKLEGLNGKLILQVHDELLLEVPADQAVFAGERLQTIMTGVVSLSVPLKVDWGYGKNWDEAH